jgi:hypothetical protein
MTCLARSAASLESASWMVTGAKALSSSLEVQNIFTFTTGSDAFCVIACVSSRRACSSEGSAIFAAVFTRRRKIGK